MGAGSNCTPSCSPAKAATAPPMNPDAWNHQGRFPTEPMIRRPPA